MKAKKLGARFWWTALLLGFVGQLAWAIENNYINLWVYSQTSSTEGITWMTIFSAIAATLTTILMGTLSDRVGKRKLFMSIGYIVWGFSVFFFGLLSYDNIFSMVKNEATAILLVGVFMTIADCVMTFFGSTSNDACFNAMITDDTDTTNRGKVESVLSVLPLFANIVMMAIGMPLYVGSTTANTPLQDQVDAGSSMATVLAKPWLIYFLICGAIVTTIGIISIFLIPKDRCPINRSASYGQKLIYGFRPSVMKKNHKLYIALLAFMGFNCAINAFMPYYLVYFQSFPSVGAGTSFYISMAIILVGASLVALLAGLFMDKVGRLKFLLPGVIVAAGGALGLYFASSISGFVIAGLFMMSGYLVSTAVLGATVRDETPRDNVGLFQGVRMFFAVLLPMIISPLISQAFFVRQSSVDPNNPSLNGLVPTNAMFLVSLAFFVISLIPIFWLLFSEGTFHFSKKEKVEQK